MAKVKLTRNRFEGPVVVRLGGHTYSITHEEFVDMPLWSAVSLIGDEGMIIEFNASDERGISELSSHALRVLAKEFGAEPDAKAIKKIMFPKKTRKPRKKKEVEPVKEEKPAEKPVEERIVEEPPVEIESEEE